MAKISSKVKLPTPTTLFFVFFFLLLPGKKITECFSLKYFPVSLSLYYRLGNMCIEQKNIKKEVDNINNSAAFTAKEEKRSLFILDDFSHIILGGKNNKIPPLSH